MVFSQTSQKTQSILKVVEIDRLKANPNHQANGLTGVVTGVNIVAPRPPSPMATTSFSEEYLKPEPLFENTMFHEEDCEFFQDLVQWCSAPAKEEQLQIIDSAKINDQRAHNTDTVNTPFSPQGWDVIPPTQAGFYSNTPTNELSPIDNFTPFDNKFLYPLDMQKDNGLQFQEKFLDISSLPVVIEDLTHSKVAEPHPWQVPGNVGWTNTHDTINTNIHNTMPFINSQEDSIDLKFTTCVIPREVESNDVVITEFILNEESRGLDLEQRTEKRNRGLAVDVTSLTPSWPTDIISTPEVLSYVEQLEEKDPLASSKHSNEWETQDSRFTPMDTCAKPTILTPTSYEPVTPKSESHTESENDTHSLSSKRRRQDSEDSDETYTPHSERSTPKRYKRRRPNVPIKDMILALEGSQQLTKARRGRPPKRRESTVSSVCSVDDNASTTSTHEHKYRELRDKNNEASKRSRMNRKLKELQMEQLAVELEERNKKLRIKAETLEDMTKRLKEAFMATILKK